MATLAFAKPRLYEVDENPSFNDLPIIASDTVYEGAACGFSSGNVRPLVATDVFAGFADETTANEGGSAGAKTVKVRQKGTVKIPITGVTGVTNHGSTVYASDDDTFTLTSTSNTAIGKVARFISGTTCTVYFEAAQLQSI